MIGEPKSRANLEGEIRAKASLVGDISSRCVIGDVEVGRVVIKREDAEEYKGYYIVTPTGERQILETANKKLTDDVEVKAIPYYDVANEYGRTIYIGGEL